MALFLPEAGYRVMEQPKIVSLLKAGYRVMEQAKIVSLLKAGYRVMEQPKIVSLYVSLKSRQLPKTMKRIKSMGHRRIGSFIGYRLGSSISLLFGISYLDKPQNFSSVSVGLFDFTYFA